MEDKMLAEASGHATNYGWDGPSYRAINYWICINKDDWVYWLKTFKDSSVYVPIYTCASRQEMSYEIYEIYAGFFFF